MHGSKSTFRTRPTRRLNIDCFLYGRCCSFLGPTIFDGPYCWLFTCSYNASIAIMMIIIIIIIIIKIIIIIIMIIIIMIIMSNSNHHHNKTERKLRKHNCFISYVSM